jgi:cytochrome c peroxidase
VRRELASDTSARPKNRYALSTALQRHAGRESPMIRTLRILVILILCCAVSKAQTQAKIDKRTFRFPGHIPAPANNQVTPARADLGKMLFFDPRLSGSGSISCASCHNPGLSFSDGLPAAIGSGMGVLNRSTPTILNSGLNKFQMWDGRYASLEEQALGPMQGSKEMNGNMEQILALLKSLPGYCRAFKKAYPGVGITKETLAKALATFERTIVSTNSPFDEWIHGNRTAISPAAKRGFALFVGKAKCVLCHSGPNFTDDGFHNIGLNDHHDNDNHDEGRYAVVPIKISKGAFKTPTLRDIARTAPYMHNGAYRTLQEVIDHYDRGGDNKENLDPNITPLRLTKQEKEDLAQFLTTLTGKEAAIVLPKLPQ